MKVNVLNSVCCATAIIICTVFHSCNNENEDYETNNSNMSKKYIPEPIKIPSATLEWDESYHPYDSKLKAENHSHEMAVTNSNIYVGGLYKASSIEDLSFSYISNPVKSIDVSFTFPRYYFDYIQRPSISSMYRSLNKAIESPSFSGKQNLSFEYDFREFAYYKELKLAFGANVNIATIFKIDASHNETKIKSTSGLFARVVQKNFSMIMDYPENGNIFLNEADMSKTAGLSPVYVNSIIFGRMAIIAIESDYSYEEVKTAFKATLTAAKINGELNITAEQKKIMQEAQIKIFVSGGASQDVAKIVEGFDEYKNFIINGGEFTRDVPGVPIFFTANYASDNSVFNTTFSTN